MRRTGRAALLAALVAGAAPLAGCGEARDTEPAVSADTGGALDGLTREQIRQQVEMMSPAEAESLGIADSAITVGSPVPTDTSLPTPVLPDTGRGRDP